MMNLQNQVNDQNVDLSEVSKGIANAYEKFGNFIFGIIRFFIRNYIIIILLLILGVILGIFLDRSKTYKNQVIVTPNFNTADYLYSKIDLLNAKIEEHDTEFLKHIGIKNPDRLKKITIKPINDIYNFVNNNEFRYKTLELMTEDTETQKILSDKTTSRNYTFHEISFITSEKTSREKTLVPLLKFLNDSDYYTLIQKQYKENALIKYKENAVMISQIDGILGEVSKRQKEGGNLIYNGDSQLNDIITSKEQLIREQASNRLSLINIDTIIKENSHTLNAMTDDTLSGKWKLILPLFFVGLFIIISLFISFYKKHSLKEKNPIN